MNKLNKINENKSNCIYIQYLCGCIEGALSFKAFVDVGLQ